MIIKNKSSPNPNPMKNLIFSQNINIYSLNFNIKSLIKNLKQIYFYFLICFQLYIESEEIFNCVFYQK